MKISVVTAVLNRAGTIAHTISSVQDQTYGDVEHVIQDGQSTDGTLDEIRKQMNGQALLISEPDSDFVGLLHSDDFFAGVDMLEKIAAAPHLA